MSKWQLNEQRVICQLRCKDGHKYICVMVIASFKTLSIRLSVYEFSLLMRYHALS